MRRSIGNNFLKNKHNILQVVPQIHIYIYMGVEDILHPPLACFLVVPAHKEVFFFIFGGLQASFRIRLEIT
jgi:hypothetical protein